MEEILVALLSAALGAIFSFLFEFFPGVEAWFAGLGKIAKQLVVAGVLFVVSAAIFGAGCAGLLQMIYPALAELSCDVPGAWLVLGAWLSAVGGAQVFHLTANKLIHVFKK